jgi:hypothetical protein
MATSGCRRIFLFYTYGTVPTGVKEEKFAHTVQWTIQSLEDKRQCLPSWTLLMVRIV